MSEIPVNNPTQSMAISRRSLMYINALKTTTVQQLEASGPLLVRIPAERRAATTPLPSHQAFPTLHTLANAHQQHQVELNTSAAPKTQVLKSLAGRLNLRPDGLGGRSPAMLRPPRLDK